MSYVKNAVFGTVPQSAPASVQQVKNEAGGYSFPVTKWTRLRRWLVLGSESGSYYASERTLTLENVQALDDCIKEQGTLVVDEIKALSLSGRAPKQDTILYALASCCASPDLPTRQAAYAAITDICRTGTHLFQFLGYIELIKKGHVWPRGLRQAVARWYEGQKSRDLAYQMTKYQSREGWTHRDVLRLCHARSDWFGGGLHAKLYNWACGRFEDWNALRDLNPPTPIIEVATYMAAFHELQGLKAEPKRAATLIAQHRLPREVVPTELLTDASVWEALLADMPMTAMVRNLATMTRVGLLAPNSQATATVIKQLYDADRIVKARLHPISVLAALTTYAQGHGVRGNNTWTPVREVVDALDSAFYLAFGSVETTSQRYMLGLDVSSSMSTGSVSGIPNLSPRGAASAMAMVTARTEPVHTTMAFSQGFVPLDISPRMRLDDIIRGTSNLPFERTDCARPMLWALNSHIPVDVFVIYTDSETWAGDVHPHVALDRYRDKMGIPAKLVVVGMTSNGFSIADPNDAGMLDVVGFDTATPNILADFALGRV